MLVFNSISVLILIILKPGPARSIGRASAFYSSNPSLTRSVDRRDFFKTGGNKSATSTSQKYFHHQKVDHAIYWMKRKQPILQSTRLGKKERSPSKLALLRMHFMYALQSYILYYTNHTRNIPQPEPCNMCWSPLMMKINVIKPIIEETY